MRACVCVQLTLVLLLLPQLLLLLLILTLAGFVDLPILSFNRSPIQSSKALSYYCVPTVHQPPIHRLLTVIVLYNAKIGCNCVRRSICYLSRSASASLHARVPPPSDQTVKETNSDVINQAVVCFCGHVARPAANADRSVDGLL